MAQPAAVKQPSRTNDSIGAALALSAAQGRYLQTVRKLCVAYQRARGGAPRQIFVRMIRAFM